MLTFIGRGSAFNVKEGNTSAYFLYNNSLFLFDCGCTVFGKILEHNILDGVRNVYVTVTHTHSDHIGSLPDLIYYCKYAKNIRVCLFGLNNMAGCDILKKVTSYLHICGIDPSLYDIESSGYGNSINAYLNTQTIKTFHTDSMDSVAIKMITKTNEEFLYTGDCYTFDWNIFTLDEWKNMTIYVECCSGENGVHYNIDRLYNDINDVGINIKNIWCMHFDCDETISRALELGFNIVEAI